MALGSKYRHFLAVQPRNSVHLYPDQLRRSGKIIAKLTGEPLIQFVQQQQFERAGMKNTSYGSSPDVTPHVASLYTYMRILTTGTQTTGVEKSNIIHTRYEALPTYLYPVAGIQTTSNDLARWVLALQDGKLIAKSSPRQLWTPQPLKGGTYGGFSDEINSYGLGWPVMRRTSHPAINPYRW